MARTPFAKTLKNLITLAQFGEKNRLSSDQLIELHAHSTMSRREALLRALEMAAALPVAGMLLPGREALAAQKLKTARSARRHIASFSGPVVIIGAGTAGLTAAYRLNLAGIPCVIYEASNRVGGRMFTQHGFNSEGMFCERGGELVDTGHTELIDLCGEVGLEIQSFQEPDKSIHQELYFINGKLYTMTDLLRGFRPFAQQLIADQKKIYGADDVATPTYLKPFNSLGFDSMSLKDYLYKKQGVESWVLDLINVCYTGEYGLDTEQQSAMNLIAQIGTDSAQDVKLLGESDECKRIKGGNSQLPETLARLLKTSVPIHNEHELIKIRDDGSEITLVFNNNGATIEVRASQVISAIPFTILRRVEGVSELGLSPRKKLCIETLGYGTNAKMMTGYKTKFWRQLSAERKSNGLVYSNTTGQEFWETSRMQPGVSGVITSFMGGTRGRTVALADQADIVAHLNLVFPGAKAYFDGNRVFQHWPTYRYTLGSYTCQLPGQYNQFVGSAQEPELGGRLCFAGEHTSVDSSGFMNGAVSSGNRVARDILASRGLSLPEQKRKNG